MTKPNASGIPEAHQKTSRQVRSAFLDFFRGKGHEVVASGPLVPANDPTLMFANAGMVQFKDVFTGKEVRSYRRAASSQKCIRISGKHNDLENVGVTARHHTFFEMLGNFSFGDYFKEEAIAYAWELLTKTLGLPPERMCVTVFGGDPASPELKPDEEARALWKKVTGYPDERIIGMGMKDNFWQMGDTGPCGPCTEIHYHLGGEANLATFGEEPDATGKGWMEIWNLVFMQFERSLHQGQARLDPLPKPCVDTGAGLERLSSVLQGKDSNYESDLLQALVQEAARISGKKYGATQDPDDVSMRVIADHARTTAFLVSEGVFPDRGGREYVLRRVMRRAIRHGHRLGIARPFLHEVALSVVDLMGDAYPELRERRELIATVTEQEEVRFRQTIDRGLRILDDEVARLRTSGSKMLSGEAAFRLYDTFGFPLDLTEVIVRERGLAVDEAGYEKALEEQRLRSEGSKVGEEAVEQVWRTAQKAVTEAHPQGIAFVGYEHEKAEGKVLALVGPQGLVTSAGPGEEVSVLCDTTPFYGESGGQVGDQGVIRVEGGPGLVRVTDTQKPLPGLIAHRGKVEGGTFSVGARVVLEVDHEKRSAVRRNHSATHLLHWALRTVLGDHATQKGSLVGPDRLRFDFSFGRALTAEEVSRIENLVNEKVLVNAPVVTEVLSMADAKKKGAMAIFEEKYGDVVRVLTMTSDSVELCGGTHARALGDIGLFKIVGESGVAAGVRRVEAVTGFNALKYVRELENRGAEVARALGTSIDQAAQRAERLREEKRALEKEVADLQRKIALGGSTAAAGGAEGGGQGPLSAARTIPGGKVLAMKVNSMDAATLREVAEQTRDRLGPSVVLVASVSADKVALVCAVSKDLTAKYKAGDLVKAVAREVGGSGGGRPDMAQAGGTDVAKVDHALEVFYRLFQ